MKRASIFSLLLAVFTGCAANVEPASLTKAPELDATADDDAIALAEEGKADSARRPTLIGELASGEEGVAGFRTGSRYLAWSFDANEGDTIRLWAEGVEPSFVDPVLILYRATRTGRPSGTNLAFNDDTDGLNSFIEFRATETRKYVAVTRRYDYGSTGAVRVRLNIEAAERVCGTLLGLSCNEGEFCHFEPEAQCGAADQGGTCMVPPTVCTKEFRQVCGCDGNTYSNACHARAAGTSVASEGPCRVACGGRGGPTCGEGEFCNYDAGQNCGRDDRQGFCAPRPEICPENYSPVCGCNGETYGNACEAATAGIGIDYEGPCGASDCRSMGCGEGEYCTLCWTSFACIPVGAVC